MSESKILLNEGFIKSYNKEKYEGYFLEYDFPNPEKLHELHNDIPFLAERKKTEKVEKLVTNLHDKGEYVIHLQNLRQALNLKLGLENPD